MFFFLIISDIECQRSCHPDLRDPHCLQILQDISQSEASLLVTGKLLKGRRRFFLSQVSLAKGRSFLFLSQVNLPKGRKYFSPSTCIGHYIPRNFKNISWSTFTTLAPGFLGSVAGPVDWLVRRVRVRAGGHTPHLRHHQERQQQQQYNYYENFGMWNPLKVLFKNNIFSTRVLHSLKHTQ